MRISNLRNLLQSLCVQGRSLSILVWRSPSTLPGWVTIPPPWASRLLWEVLFGWALLFHLRIHFVYWLFPVFLSRTRWVPWRHRLRPLFPFQCHVGNILFGGFLTIKLLHMLCQHMWIRPQSRRLTLYFTYIVYWSIISLTKSPWSSSPIFVAHHLTLHLHLPESGMETTVGRAFTWMGLPWVQVLHIYFLAIMFSLSIAVEKSSTGPWFYYNNVVF